MPSPACEFHASLTECLWHFAPHILAVQWEQFLGWPVDFPGGSDGKESACQAGDPGLIPGLRGSPGGGNGNSLQYACLKNSMDRGACAWLQPMGYSPWTHKESDTIEQVTLSLSSGL